MSFSEQSQKESLGRPSPHSINIPTALCCGTATTMTVRQRRTRRIKKPTGRSALVLASGGIDSTACIHLLQQRGLEVSALFVDFGQAARIRERTALKRVCRKLYSRFQEITVVAPRRYGPGEVVGRNAFLIFTALMYARPPQGAIALGIHAGTPYFDCSAAFLTSVSRLVEDCTNSQNQVVAPFLTWSKADIVTYACDEGLPIDLTYSCERGRARPCGQCLSCRDRRMLGVG